MTGKSTSSPRTWGGDRCGRGGRALLARFIAVETGSPPQPGDAAFLNILHMTAAWHRHGREFANIEQRILHPAAQPDALREMLVLGDRGLRR